MRRHMLLLETSERRIVEDKELLYTAPAVTDPESMT